MKPIAPDVLIAIGKEYMRTTKTIPQLAIEYDVPDKTLSAYALRNKWSAKRKARVNRAIAAVEKEVDKDDPNITVAMRDYHALLPLLLDKARRFAKMDVTTPREAQAIAYAIANINDELRQILRIPKVGYSAIGPNSWARPPAKPVDVTLLNPPAETIHIDPKADPVPVEMEYAPVEAAPEPPKQFTSHPPSDTVRQDNAEDQKRETIHPIRASMES